MSKLVKMGIISMSAMVLVACGGDTGTSEEDTDKAEDTELVEEVDAEEEVEEEVEEDAKEGILEVGDSMEIEDVAFTVTGAEFVDERNEYADTEADKVLKISYKIDNNAEEDYPFGMDGDLYVDGSKAETYPNDNSMGSVSSGRSVEGVQHYAVVGDPTEIELEWEPLFSFAGEKGIWDVNPQ